MNKLAYTSEFIGKNSHIYKIEIYRNTNDDIIVENLLLIADEPVIIEYISDDLFQPLKQSACTVNLLTDMPLLDLYTGKLNDITLKLYKDNKLFWFGFLTPNIYSSEYNSRYDLLTLEFIDTIAQLKNIKFNHYVEGFSSFIALMSEAFEKVDKDKVINEIYYPTHLKVNDSTEILNNLYIQNRNFYDEEKDPETYNTVLEEIAKYLGMTLIQIGNKYMLLDYPSLKAGNYTFNVYNRTTGKTTQTTLNKTVKDLYDIGIAEANGSISLGDVYNKVKIIASNNPTTQTLPELFNDLTNQNENPNKYYDITSSLPTQSNEYLQAYFNSSIWITGGCWNNSTEFKEVTPDILGGEKGIYKGTFFQKMTSYRKEDGEPSSLSWTDYLTMKSNMFSENENNKINLSYKKDDVIYKGGYFIIDIEYLLSKNPYPLYTPDSELKFKGKIRDTKFQTRLQIGNYYFDGNEWTTTPSYFYLARKNKEGDKVMYETVHLTNQVSYKDELVDSSDGALIKLPEFVLFGQLNFELYKPYGLGGAFTEIDVHPTDLTKCPTFCHIKNMKMIYTNKYQNIDIFNTNNNDIDTLYENEINSEFITEFGDLELKVNTYNEKAGSYSYVIYKKDDVNYDFIEGIYNSNTKKSEKMEEQIINKYVNHYSSPKLEYSNTLNNCITFYDVIYEKLMNKNMIIDSIRYNLVNDSADVTLKEL